MNYHLYQTMMEKKKKTKQLRPLQLCRNVKHRDMIVDSRFACVLEVEETETMLVDVVY